MFGNPHLRGTTPSWKRPFWVYLIFLVFVFVVMILGLYF